jgi:DMSO/TMAO reductase YedYZ heme-binding membrane subunit
MLNNFCQSLSQLFLKYKKVILFFYKALVFLGVLTVFLTWLITPLNPFWRDLGELSGSASAVLLFISLLPGMMKRFGVTGCLQSAQVVLMSYRRYTGIAMYLTATSHYLWIKFLPAVTIGISPFAANTFELMGTVALMIALPLLLTSNDQSIKLFKKNWHRLQKLSYLVLFFVNLHLWLLGDIESTALLMTMTLFLEMASYLWPAVRKKYLQ